MIAPRIQVIGVPPGAPALPAEARGVAAACGVLVGAERQLALVPTFAGEVWPVEGRLAEIVEKLAAKPGLTAAVLASGDPGFFGIAGIILRRIAREEVRIWPAVSSLQLAFARAGETWSEARFASLHGRPLENLAAVLGAPKVGLFTDPQHTPRVIARFLIESGWDDLEMVVAEDLGMTSERVSRGSPAHFGSWDGSPLNVVLLLRDGPDPRPLGPGLPESGFSHSRGLITKREVRAAALGLLGLPREGVLWDVGAGSGSVAVEACLLAPALRVHAVEKTAEGLGHVVENRRRFRTAGLIPVPGEAPAALAGLPDPDRVFVGGSGGALGPIATHCWERLTPGGALVMALVLVDSVCAALAWARQTGLEPELTEVNVARSRAVAERQRLDPQNPVILARFEKPTRV